MASASASKELQDLVLLINRVALGLYFLLAGAHKIGGGVSDFYHGMFQALRPAWLPTWFAAPYGHALPFAEVAFGAMLVAGFAGRLAAGVLTLMLVSFTLALTSKGAFFSGPGPFHANVIFLTLVILLAVMGPGSLSADAIWRKPGRKAF